MKIRLNQEKNYQEQSKSRHQSDHQRISKITLKKAQESSPRSFQSYSGSSTKDIGSSSQKKVLGLPVNAIVFLLVILTALGASVYTKTLKANVRFVATDYSEFTPLGWSDNETYTVTGGGNLTKGFEIGNDNSASGFTARVMMSANEPGLIQSDGCQIWLLNSSFNELANDSSVSGHDLQATADYYVRPLSTTTGYWRIVCSQFYNDTIALRLEMTPN